VPRPVSGGGSFAAPRLRVGDSPRQMPRGSQATQLPMTRSAPGGKAGVSVADVKPEMEAAAGVEKSIAECPGTMNGCLCRCACHRQPAGDASAGQGQGAAEARSGKRSRSPMATPSSASASASQPAGPAWNFRVRPLTLRPLMEEALVSWEMDALALCELTDSRPLSTFASYLFERVGLVERFSMDKVRMTRFFEEIERGYKDNPYHNRTHAASVLHIMHVLLSMGGVAASCAAAGADVADEERRVALVQMAGLLAAAVHDFEHEGLSNDFLVKTVSPKALRYNDCSVNENHHVEAAFEVLERPDCNFLEAMDASEFRLLRGLVVDMVLSTDMADGNAYLKRFKEAIEVTAASAAPSSPSTASAALAPGAAVGAAAGAGGFQPSSAEEAILGLQIALKCADIGHLSLSWSGHMQWVQRLEMEFFLQGDRERDRSMDLGFLMDRRKPGVSQTQVGFFDFVVLPLFGTFESAFPLVAPIVDAVRANRGRWVEIEAWSKAEAEKADCA